MKTKLLLAALVAMAVSSPVSAAYVIGSADCGQWVNRNGGKIPPTWEGLITERWLTGFLSGLNQGDSQNRNSLKKVSAEQIFLWMDNYCKANPLKNVAYGAEDLMDELRKK